ncbi:hypothetical protein [Streptomyces sp. NPDC001296]
MRELAAYGPAAIERATQIARVITEKSVPPGVRAVLDSAHPAQEQGERAAIERLRPTIARLAATAHGAEGIRSFVERDAAFTGR